MSPKLWSLASSVGSVLDGAAAEIGRRGATQAVKLLVPELDELYDRACSAGRLLEFKHACQAHPAWNAFMEDPYTHRAFTKPRGYAGDAVMLDYVYCQRPPAGTSRLGQEVFAATTGTSIGKSVRFRRDALAKKIASLVRERGAITIASIACGHLRERVPELAGTSCDWIAVDQDAQSLALVNQEHAHRVRTMQASVVDLARGKVPLPSCDFAYCSGLFDYLSDRLARSLTRLLLTRLNAGGVLWLANFAPDTYGRAYLSGIMNWDLIYRDERDLRDTFGDWEGLVTTWRDPYENIVFAEASHEA